ncbi:MAG: 30S ribosomal protein S20 [cyanobacterium endosymbiont of Epithemia adnata isolate EadnSB Bon19]|uniref:30S ribosomal protein S20 n=1 Tax=cyanobacterium endosymbiont of Epithemia turgida TaxID=718217 RepID=UPI0004D18991|nr:30S ribosomal protein S20 [cyanobacterium endosymbiont of Epithemia turgida]BAP17256.1 30S ribosomal protein S20 [cyanobacterium endosymbiont of Epithemia turgida isolate EtSB Lake Yunoko]
MANSKSALKRIDITERNRLRNKAYRSALRTLMKKHFKAVEEYAANPTSDNKTVADESLSAAYSKIDKAVKRRVLHKNNGARKKARLAKAFKEVAMVS